MKSAIYIIALLILIGIATATSLMEAEQWWSTYQNTELGTGREAAESLFTYQAVTSSYSGGQKSVQTLIGDLDQNNVTEAYLNTGAYLMAIHSDHGTVSIETQQGAVRPQLATGELIYDSGTGKYEWLIPSSHDYCIYVYTYNGSFFNNSFNVTFNAAWGNITAFKCSSDSELGGGPVCFFTTYGGRLGRYDFATSALDNRTLGATCHYTTVGGDIHYPSIAYDSNFNGNVFAVACPANTKLYLQEASFYGAITVDYAADVVAFFPNIHGGQDLLLVGAVVNAANPSTYIRILDSTGTQKYYKGYVSLGDSGNMPTINAVIGLFTSLDHYQCFATSSYSSTQLKVLSLDPDDAAGDALKVDFMYNKTGAKTIIEGYESMFAMDIDGDGYHEVITPYQIIDFQDNDYKLNWSTHTGGRLSAGDISLESDGIFEIIGTELNEFYIKSSNDVNDAPTWLGIREYGKNWDNPLCVGTTLTITAWENGSSEYYHYVNDVSTDQERLISTCGTNTSYYNGSYSTAAPSLDCYYALPGAYTARVYLQDTINDDDFTQFDSITVVVINGTPGMTCNLMTTPETIYGREIVAAAAAGQDQQITDLFEILTGGSALVKLLLSLAVTIGMIVLLASMRINSPLIYAISIFAVWVILAVLDFMSWIYIVVYAFIAFFISIMAFISGNRAGG